MRTAIQLLLSSDMPNNKGQKREGSRITERGLGRPESVLNVTFVETVTKAVLTSEDDDSDILPFIEYKLPTKEAVLKLYVFLRDLEGNKRISTNTLIDKVTDFIIHYWQLANN